jgi:hypothetical protein
MAMSVDVAVMEHKMKQPNTGYNPPEVSFMHKRVGVAAQE